MAARRWVRPTEALAIGLAAWLLVSCTSDTATERTATTSAALNTSPTINNFVLYAERSVKLGSFDLISGGDVGVAAVSVPTFGDQLVVGDHAQVTVSNNLLAPSVTLGSKSQVGDVQTNALHNNGATSVGTVAPYPSPMPPIPIAGAPGSSSQDVSIGTHQTVTLSPGVYGDLSIGEYSSVFFTAGTYSFANVAIGDHATLSGDPNGVALLVSGAAAIGGWDQIGPSGATAEKLTILVGGTDGPSASPPALGVGQHAQVTALMAAPHGTLSVADSSSVYWTDEAGGSVMKVPIGGGAVTTLASNRMSPSGLALDGQNVYWTEFTDLGGVLKVPLGGGAIGTLAMAQAFPTAIAVTAGQAYWTDSDNGASNAGSIVAAPLSAGATSTIVSGQANPNEVTGDGQGVYWTDFGTATSKGSVMAIDVASRAVTTLASGQDSPNGIAVDANNVYWTTFTMTGSVMKVSRNGGTPVTLASAQPAPAWVAVDAQNVYWTNYGSSSSDGSVMKAPLSGGAPVTLASNQPSPSGVAVDQASLYWVAGAPGSNMGVVMKLSPK